MSYRTIAIKIVKEAGKILLKEFGNKNYKAKSRYDIVTKADLKSEKYIISEIKKFFPAQGILSEEIGEIGGSSEYQWIIDPLDGTVNFSQGLGDFCISIALIHKQQTILGIIYQPLLNNLYYAEKGKGAFLNNKKIHVARKKSISEMIGATECAVTDEARRKNFETLTKINDAIKSIRITGSTTLNLAYVAAGKLDFYFNNRLNIWDVAAGFLLIEEAGGKITDLEGRPIEIASGSSVATHKGIQEELRKKLKIQKKRINPSL
jgi:myo-inositol-1(or 4)-monophosphatase